jgi:hypothetical protein
LIGPGSPALRPGDKLSIEQLDDDIILQRRIAPDGGVVEIRFSLKFCGNVVSVSAVAKSPGVRSQFGKYMWKKLKDGRCMLDQCEFRMTRLGSVTENEEVYRLKVKSFDVETPVPPGAVSEAAIKSYLPRNADVIDDITKKSYPLDPSAKQPIAAFKDLSGSLKARGFLLNK